MIPKELLKKVRQIHIRTSRMVNDILAGQYQSVFKGQGIEFEEVREYQAGDEIRAIDWNVTARMGKPFIKKFVEERELTVMLVVDASSSGEFGSFDKLKKEIAAELCAMLAFSAIKNNDKVGLIIFTDRVEKFVPPKKGKRHVLRVIREVLFFKPQHKGTDIACALQFLSTVTRRRTITFLVSDFLARDYGRALRIANKRHDIIAIVIADPREVEFPDVGFIELEDFETGEVRLVDSNDLNLRKAFKVLNARDIQERNRFFRSINMDAVDIRTDRSYIEPLIRFFRMREKRR
ncbi:MAG TPA: DUF58 domain-containing protein [Candidatus Omnitrophica bacterium]|nr:DUF58 domain-containing protein [Candidatus Omnitrophota bacterium]